MRWVQLCSSFTILWHFLSLGLEWKLKFSSPVATAEFSKFAGILSATFSQRHPIRFEIAQLEFHHPLLALFVVMLPKAHLTSHSKMSGSRRVITVLQSWRSFLYSSVYPCYLFLISSASVRSILFLSFIMPIFAWNVSLASLILKVYIKINFLVILTSLGKYFVNLSVKYTSSSVFLSFLKGSPHHHHHHHPTFLQAILGVRWSSYLPGSKGRGVRSYVVLPHGPW